MDEIARHKLWCKADELFGGDVAALFMEHFRPAYESLMARQAAGETTLSLVPHLSGYWDKARHRIWRKVDEVMGSENAVTLIELWDETQRLSMGLVSSRAA